MLPATTYFKIRPIQSFGPIQKLKIVPKFKFKSYVFNKNLWNWYGPEYIPTISSNYSTVVFFYIFFLIACGTSQFITKHEHFKKCNVRMNLIAGIYNPTNRESGE